MAALRGLSRQSWRRLQNELASWVALRGRQDPTLGSFLHDQALTVDEVYRSGATNGPRSGWTSLKREVGLLLSEPGPEEAYFSRRFAALLHVDDPIRLDGFAQIAARRSAEGVDPAVAQMLAYQIDSQHTQTGDPAAFAERLAGNPAAASDLLELVDLLKSRSSLAVSPIPGLEDLPLCLHAAYGIREILTAVGWLTSAQRTPFQAGLLALPSRRTELLFVTIDKSQGYHAGVRYHDYAISPDRFHWQTQNSAGPDTPVGRRYLESPGNGWQYQLFVREKPGDPYRACGPLQLESCEGDRPMTLVWRLQIPLPARLFSAYSLLKGN